MALNGNLLIHFNLSLKNTQPAVTVYISGILDKDQGTMREKIPEAFPDASITTLPQPDTDRRIAIFPIPEGSNPDSVSSYMKNLISLLQKQQYAVAIDMGTLDIIQDKIQELEETAQQKNRSTQEQIPLGRTIRSLHMGINTAESQRNSSLQIINNYSPNLGNRVGILLGVVGVALLFVAGFALTPYLSIPAAIGAVISFGLAIYASTTPWFGNRDLYKKAVPEGGTSFSDKPPQESLTSPISQKFHEKDSSTPLIMTASTVKAGSNKKDEESPPQNLQSS